MTNNLKLYSPEWDALETLVRLKTPDENANIKELREYWMKLREVAKLATNGAYLAAMNCGKAEEKENAAYHPETAENGQQTNIPPTGGQQAMQKRKKEEEQDEPFKVTHNPHAKQFEVIAITPDMTPMYIIPYSTAINAHKNYRIETARARAEAVRDRLNEEWKNKTTN